MCAISPFPEAGDASVDIMSAKRKDSVISDIKDISLMRREENAKSDTSRYIPAYSINSINTVKNDGFLYEEFWKQDDPLRKTSDVERVADYHGFPYYRSSRINGLQDAVLVKDVGVSCSILKDDTINPGAPITGFESYLVKQLKLEYNELSSITRKINAYTKDILNSLALRCRRKDHVLQKSYATSKRVTMSQYTNEMGSPYFKLRFCGKKSQSSDVVDVNNNFSEKDIAKRKIYGKRASMKRRYAEFDKRVLEFSSKCSDVLLRNYLITKREKVSNNSSKTSLHKAEISASPSRLCRHRGANKSCRSFYTSKCDPLVLTNWREVSKQSGLRIQERVHR